MTTLETLYESLVQSQNDWQVRSVLADWFEEAGEQGAAACRRWVARNRRRPGFHPRPSEYGPFIWVLQADQPIIEDPPAHLPEALWQPLTGNGEPHPVASFKSYRTAT